MYPSVALDTSSYSSGKFLPNLKDSVVSTFFNKRPYIPKFNNDVYLDYRILGDNFFKLREFKSLKKGWDGYSANEISFNVIDRTIKLLKEIKVHTNIFPTASGTIQVEKFIDENNLFEVEVTDDVYVYYSLSNGMECEEVISEENVVLRINTLYNGE